MAKRFYFMTDIGRYAFGYIEKADDKAPPGATWKPDGKFKASIVIEPEALEKAVVEAAEASGYDPNAEGFFRPYEASNVEKYPEDAGKVVLEAKSKFRPTIYDGLGSEVKGVFPKGGDMIRMKIELNPFEKTEKVRENGKMVDAKIQGVSARLVGIQIARRGGGGGFGAVDGGWTAGDERSSTTTDEAPSEGASGADF